MGHVEHFKVIMRPPIGVQRILEPMTAEPEKTGLIPKPQAMQESINERKPLPPFITAH